jgi:hypothetical protein
MSWVGKYEICYVDSEQNSRFRFYVLPPLLGIGVIMYGELESVRIRRAEGMYEYDS